MFQDVANRLWNRLEDRYTADEEGGCDCGSEAPPEALAVIENSKLTEDDLISYYKGELPFEELVATIDADLENEAITDLHSLAVALGERTTETSANTSHT
ncbi:hypothetical protein [Halocatena pleomorpha]|uniref:Uncharacterized protein n=1 Tax=Halocatena pleomorpha TaxID=1785090 RepID=A0A3P3RKN2_9EURY|nr:hypothetical protein [Halocatena pleomorpha]RRJ34081.1 hypothetical protein EIK79_00870 [Halocatena pleomorpha]